MPGASKQACGSSAAAAELGSAGAEALQGVPAQQPDGEQVQDDARRPPEQQFQQQALAGASQQSEQPLVLHPPGHQTLQQQQGQPQQQQQPQQPLSDEQLRRVLQCVFGHMAFRGRQLEVVREVSLG